MPKFKVGDWVRYDDNVDNRTRNLFHGERYKVVDTVGRLYITIRNKGIECSYYSGPSFTLVADEFPKKLKCISDGDNLFLTKGNYYFAHSYSVEDEYIYVRDNQGVIKSYEAYLFDLTKEGECEMKEHKKYNTNPIDYTGCDPVIAEALKSGNSIECLVGASPGTDFVHAYMKPHYVGDNFRAYNATPVETSDEVEVELSRELGNITVTREAAERLLKALEDALS